MTDTNSSLFPSTFADHWCNLLWALGTENISQLPALPWLPRSRREELRDFFAAPAIRASLENNLRGIMESAKSRRLGIYFENLWAFAFKYHPEYHLLAHNLPIRVEGKTLGELDFVVRYLPDDVTEHWEVAVKFYLQVDDYWVGPGLKDRLDIKLARTRDHQLPIIEQPDARALLKNQDIDIQRQWTLMPGRRFQQLHAAPKEGACWWTDWQGFLEHFADKTWHWLQLPKQCWLAPCAPTHSTPQVAVTYAAPKVHAQLGAHGPLCMAAVVGNREVSRGFIVPDDWQERAHQSLRQQ
ncbi:DUF1853 family protein [uncultured Microbulbifer sp.]|uniref:DUF1853 family protein n=1 Tax=uncultured Microbulbifer sp. TaxID=348147 RepID=UPI0025E8CA39|nr:DUF1853 family protein [uncultured Microbulbifer sp.]